MRKAMMWGGGVLGLLVAGGSIWWVTIAGLQEAGLTRWLEDQTRRGWQAEAGAVEVTGYPLDFNLRAEEIALSDPRAGWSWRGPWLMAESRALQPNRMLVTLPPNHELAVPGERAEIAAERMTADLHVAARSSMALTETGVDIASLTIAGQSGWQGAAGRLAGRVALREAELSPPNSYDIRIEGAEIALPAEILSALDPTGLLTPEVDEIEISGFAALAEPLDRRTVEEGRVELRAAVLRRAGFSWGEMRLSVRGEIEVDRAGYPVGRLEVEAREWRRIVEVAEKGGLIGGDLADAISGALEFVSALSGGGELRVPLTLSDRKVRLGPVAIADAPRLAPARPD